MIRCQAVRKRLYPRHVFRIARGAKPFVENVFLAIEQKGILGYGEASPNGFYGESAEEVHMRLLGLSDWLRRQTLTEPEEIPTLAEEAWAYLSPSRAAQCALDLALWDLLAKTRGITVAELALGHAAQPLPSSATVSLAVNQVESEEQSRLLHEAENFMRLKIKVNASPDWGALQAMLHGESMRSPSGTLGKGRVRQMALDANASWHPSQATAWMKPLKHFSPYLLEQPFAPENDAELARLEFTCPVYADESCRNADDLPRLAELYDGINIKLVKCGGLSPALHMRAKAKESGLKVMVGCMLESSLLIAAGLVAAQGCDWADLDGAWLLAQDPMVGLTWTDGVLQPSLQPGFGVKACDHLPDLTQGAMP